MSEASFKTPSKPGVILKTVETNTEGKSYVYKGLVLPEEVLERMFSDEGMEDLIALRKQAKARTAVRNNLDDGKISLDLGHWGNVIITPETTPQSLADQIFMTRSQETKRQNDKSHQDGKASSVNESYLSTLRQDLNLLAEEAETKFHELLAPQVSERALKF